MGGVLLTAFACVLLLAVLLSSLANRTILSTAALLLVAGFVLGDGVLGVISLWPGDDLVATLAELALFTDGMRVGWAELRSTWRLPGRAPGWGLPLTLAVTATGAHWLLGLGWIEALLIGAILAPADPVFAAALVGNDSARSSPLRCPARRLERLAVHRARPGARPTGGDLAVVSALGAVGARAGGRGLVRPQGFRLRRLRLLVLGSGITAAEQVFQLVAVTVVASILLHGSTGIVVARWFDECEAPAWYGAATRTIRRK